MKEAQETQEAQATIKRSLQSRITLAIGIVVITIAMIGSILAM